MTARICLASPQNWSQRLHGEQEGPDDVDTPYRTARRVRLLASRSFSGRAPPPTGLAGYHRSSFRQLIWDQATELMLYLSACRHIQEPLKTRGLRKPNDRRTWVEG